MCMANESGSSEHSCQHFVHIEIFQFCWKPLRAINHSTQSLAANQKHLLLWVGKKNFGQQKMALENANSSWLQIREGTLPLDENIQIGRYTRVSIKNILINLSMCLTYVKVFTSNSIETFYNDENWKGWRKMAFALVHYLHVMHF